MNIVKWLENVASSFQPAYDKIKGWKLNPDIEKLFDEIWENLPGNIQKALWELLKAAYAKYGPEAAQVLLKNILNALKNQVVYIR